MTEDHTVKVLQSLEQHSDFLREVARDIPLLIVVLEAIVLGMHSEPQSRELALVMTKLDEARLWCFEVAAQREADE